MVMKFTNNATATLAASISPTSVSITVTTGQGALFPALAAGDYFYATLEDSSNNIEYIKVTARGGDTLTAVRGQDGTAARSYAAADRVELRVNAATMNNAVFLDGTQTITGAKTFEIPPVLEAPLPITSGGTGATTATGTGELVLADSPTLESATLVTPALGTPASGNLANCTGTAPLLIVGTAQSFNSLSWRILESGGKLYFLSGGVGKMVLDSSGNLTVSGDITAFGTPGTPTP